MRHPPYHLRLNKAVDRLTLMDAIDRLRNLSALSEYTYYGLGGPYLEEFRLLYESHPEMAMVSIENDKETFKRQAFHLPCGNVRIERESLRSFLARYEPVDRKCIFWLDYTGLEYSCFEDFQVLLRKAVAGSMVKITLRAEPRDYYTELQEPVANLSRIGSNHEVSRPAPVLRDEKADQFREKFRAIMPNPSATPPATLAGLASMLQGMLRIAAQEELRGAVGIIFQPISSFHYNDGTGMFTFTGLLCMRSEEAKVREAFGNWAFANLDWADPLQIDVPTLSTKERLHLQRWLPCQDSPGETLRLKLGYMIGNGKKDTEALLGQYAVFHRRFPYFMRGIP